MCAGDGTGKNNKSFGSECVLANHNCEQETGKWIHDIPKIENICNSIH